MDLWSIFLFIFVTFLLMSCCGYCCTSKTRGAVLSTPVVVTSATHTAPGGYPVTQITTSGYQAAPYPPYPQPTGTPAQVHYPMPMPMPMPMAQPPMPGVQQHAAPYPPMPAPVSAAQMNPPSYDAAVAATGHTVPYEKQAPYNPSFTAH